MTARHGANLCVGLLALAGAVGCSGNDTRSIPHDTATDAKAEVEVAAPSDAPARDYGMVTGVVSLGRPVSGAEVVVSTFANFEEGTVLAWATTDAFGVYEARLTEAITAGCWSGSAATARPGESRPAAPPSASTATTSFG